MITWLCYSAAAASTAGTHFQHISVMLSRMCSVNRVSHSRWQSASASSTAAAHTHCCCLCVYLQVRDTVAIHVPCSSKKMGIEDSFMKIASLCADEVVPSGIPCCGMAGDRGMRYTELTGASLQHLDLPKECKDGYSTSRTCEMSLSNHSGINFRGLVYLVDEATKPKQQAAAAAH